MEHLLYILGKALAFWEPRLLVTQSPKLRSEKQKSLKWVTGSYGKCSLYYLHPLVPILLYYTSYSY